MTIMSRYGGRARHNSLPLSIHPLSTRLIRTMKITKITEPQLATLLGITTRTIMRVRRGRVPSRKSTLLLIEMWVTRHEIQPTLELGEL